MSVTNMTLSNRKRGNNEKEQ